MAKLTDIDILATSPVARALLESVFDSYIKCNIDDVVRLMALAPNNVNSKEQIKESIMWLLNDHENHRKNLLTNNP